MIVRSTRSENFIRETALRQVGFRRAICKLADDSVFRGNADIIMESMEAAYRAIKSSAELTLVTIQSYHGISNRVLIFYKPEQEVFDLVQSCEVRRKKTLPASVGARYVAARLKSIRSIMTQYYGTNNFTYPRLVSLEVSQTKEQYVETCFSIRDCNYWPMRVKRAAAQISQPHITEESFQLGVNLFMVEEVASS